MARQDGGDENVLAALGAGVLEYLDEIAVRSHVDRTVHVFEPDAEVELTAPVPHGSMIAIVGSRSSRELMDIRAATHAHDVEGLDRALLALGDRPPRPTPAPGGIAAIPVLSEIGYRGKMIAAGLAHASESDLATAYLAFAGGHVEHHGFIATHSYTADGHELGNTLQTVVLVRQPQLSDVEQALLGRLSELDLNATVAPQLAANVFVAAATLTSGAFPFQDPALSQALQERFRGLEGWPVVGSPDAETQAVDDRVHAWLEAPEHVRELEALDARAAVETLVQLRRRILTHPY